MNSGFITTKRTVKRIGVHQRLDTASYHMIERYLPRGGFPRLMDIIHFEGYNGPDGLKVKSRGQHEPSHMYDPLTDKGEAKLHITNHYRSLVEALAARDMIRAAFEASWMAHYVGDGMTPAHHWPLEEKIAEAAAGSQALRSGDVRRFGRAMAVLRKHWAVWGVKGHLSTHMYFETGIMFALLSFKIKPVLRDGDVARARRLGAVEYFRHEALGVAELDLYERFYREGWSPELARLVKNRLAPHTAHVIGVMWLLAVLEADEQAAKVQAGDGA